MTKNPEFSFNISKINHVPEDVCYADDIIDSYDSYDVNESIESYDDNESSHDVSYDDPEHFNAVDDCAEAAGSLDLLNLMMQGVKQFPLLSKDEEIKLAKSIAENRPDAKEAMDKLVNSNLRLVVSIARKYNRHGVELPDLIQDGAIGLIKAAEKFDYTKGYRFSTYATCWIRQTISRGLSDKGRTIRIPVHVDDTLRKMRAIEMALTAKYQREPSLEEIAKAMEMPEDKLSELLSMTAVTTSLHIKVGEEKESTLEEFIGDQKAINPEENAINMCRNEAIRKALKSLTAREEQVILLRYGLDDGDPKTLEEIGNLLGITRERVRQIEHKALGKIRTRSGRYGLSDYL